MDFTESTFQQQQQAQHKLPQTGGPHFLTPSSTPERQSVSDSDRAELLQQVSSDPVPLLVSTSVFASGMNGALTRKFNLDASEIELIERAGLQPKWKPTKPRVRTFGMTFPDGLEFIPPKEEKEGQPELSKIKGPEVEGTEPAPRKKSTRLKPPANALSLEDRLFYLLQPPLETWLAGQELIMPFEPFPYQYEGIAWLFSKKSALLADEMGLGKTMQTITGVRLLLRSGQVRRILLVCPKPLIPNWQREFKFWAEELPVTVVQGDTNRRRMIWEMPNTPILIANYESMSRDFEAMGEENLPRFDLVVLDEAQRIKNRDSRTADVARSIPRKRSWALTGTPIENRHEEMSSLFEWMEIIPPRGTPDLRQLQALSKEFILRRTKDLVMTDLPPRLDRPAYLDLNPAQRIAYETAEKDGVIQLNEMGDSITVQHVFELVLRLKQITNFDPVTGDSAKLDRLEADMEEIAASGGKAILFSQWTKPLDFMAQRLERFGTLVYHGGIPTKQREPILDQFKHDPNSHLLLMSYGTGAVGLNLQFAGYVFLFDRWWNPAIEDQAINRAHRIGQKTQVIVTKFVCNNTIEERIDMVLEQKRELFRSILGDGDTTCESRSLTAAEIFGLFDLKQKKGDTTKKIAPKVPNSAA
ncbi:ATP-dependent helicase HepA [Gimesia panareensis]|uniref:ATP-dependent helicase HepA n=1 Tax=Gimesia panareensis TaxID=2527978 RepID=A0A517QEL8_9PLAN|nr:DEAD/DEAH box helicase [Gimesia panareensis]QDT30089.1 ATP-dependent helicase HepA [Gimesia panareensis]